MTDGTASVGVSFEGDYVRIILIHVYGLHGAVEIPGRGC